MDAVEMRWPRYFCKLGRLNRTGVARKGREERQKDEKIGATWIPLGGSLLLCDHYLSLHTPQKHTYPSPLITRYTIALHKQAPQRAPVKISEDNAAS